MLNSLKIQNFRLFKEFQIDDLARVNLIVGKNNVGKSTLLEAVDLLVNPRPIQVLFDLLKSRDELVQSQSNGHQLGYEFARLFNHLANGNSLNLESGQNHFSISWQQGVSGHNVYIPRGFDVNIFESGYEEPSSFTWQTSDQIMYKENIKELSRTFRDFPSVFVKYLDSNYAQLVSVWDEVQLTPMESNVVDILRIVEPDIERIANQPTNNRFVIKSKNSQTPVPMKSFGDGMSAVFGIGLGLVQAQDGYLLIDEIDTGLHYRVLTDVWRVVLETAVRLNVQVFATTHSWDCIRSFAEALSLVEDDSVGALFRLQRRGEDIESVRYEADRIIFAIEQDVEIR